MDLEKAIDITRKGAVLAAGANDTDEMIHAYSHAGEVLREEVYRLREMQQQKPTPHPGAGHKCEECAWRLTGPYEGCDVTVKKCIVDKTEPACPAFVPQAQGVTLPEDVADMLKQLSGLKVWDNDNGKNIAMDAKQLLAKYKEEA